MNIIFIHGLSGSKRFFSALELAIKEKVNVNTFSFDLLGFGENKKLGERFDLDEHLDFISNNIKQRFGKEKIILVGHSFGGVLALAWAARYPEQTLKIVLSNTPLAENKQEVLDMLEADKKSWAFWINSYPKISHFFCLILCKMGLMIILEPLKSEFVSREIFSDYRKHSWKSLSKSLENVLIEHPSYEFLNKLNNIPILQIIGKKDCNLTKRETNYQNITKVEIDSGHLTPIEKPEETAKAMVEFLRN